MQCPYCRGDSNVTETRFTADGLRRRRVCAVCKRRFTTYEKLGAPGLKVAKRDGNVEAFESDKLLLALRRVCSHRARIDDDQLRHLAMKIEALLVDTGRKTVEWSEIATLVLRELGALDPVSANRFAANYTDESGAVRFDQEALPSAQLGFDLDKPERT